MQLEVVAICSSICRLYTITYTAMWLEVSAYAWNGTIGSGSSFNLGGGGWSPLNRDFLFGGRGKNVLD